MLKERSQTFKLLFVFLDVIFSLGSCLFAFTLRFYILDPTGSDRAYVETESYIILSLLLSLSQVLVYLSIDLYHPRRGLSFADEFMTIFGGVFLNLLLVLSLLFFFRGDLGSERFSRYFVLAFAVTNIFSTSFLHFITRQLLKYLRRKGYNLRRVLVIGVRETAARFADSVFRHQIYGYQIIGYVASGNFKPIRKEMKILGKAERIEKVLLEVKPDLVVYALNNDEGEFLHDVLDACDTEGIDLKVIPGFQEFIKAKGRVDEMDGLPVISIRNIPIRLGYNRFIKRSFDILFSLTFIVLFSPFYLLLATLIKLTSKGPVFYFQDRVGLDNKSFRMIKFRSMVVQEKGQSETTWTVQNDPRVTKIGRIMRKTSLDETPQFFNVLIGDMSVVGPRPERPHFVEKFKSDHRHYMRRHAVKAGITGLAQVKGLRGDTSIDERIAADIYYIENWSLWLDIKIILLTPFKGVMDKNAY
ncbi:undecaprenyl-phosphate glucose phosphotransferase [Leptospira inadai serovar Lyme str. 10]|uniref:Undecaprenyl-phosphate glucose phosphotransferase n=2 Tax=Leptospira inadai serovar Lyme TaxID=293084 RepID=V6HXG5_9LEPT|nr:undecaprenyl-phosphate glucose phosphotransferase [Leptospira inadai]EQA37699.1 undecaprenyl-phosphate glucose phosphotransferase [Leptospira inadai serovar Lyme str. 10]PNV72808.1 undecaprenyl-phosphate glucose phosphotransferase [Leptospira inadai serovar Lyme]